jgi:hypothetical protein
MSTSALLACLALLYGIANADPAAFTVTGADSDTAVSATVAAGLKSVSVSLSGLGNSIGPQPLPGSTSPADVSSRSLFASISFAFGAELYAMDATSVSEDPEPSSWEMMILGFVGVGLMPYLVARALLPRPALSALTVQSN